MVQCGAENGEESEILFSVYSMNTKPNTT